MRPSYLAALCVLIFVGIVASPIRLTVWGYDDYGILLFLNNVSENLLVWTVSLAILLKIKFSKRMVGLFPLALTLEILALSAVLGVAQSNLQLPLWLGDVPHEKIISADHENKDFDQLCSENSFTGISNQTSGLCAMPREGRQQQILQLTLEAYRILIGRIIILSPIAVFIGLLAFNHVLVLSTTASVVETPLSP